MDPSIDLPLYARYANSEISIRYSLLDQMRVRLKPAMISSPKRTALAGLRLAGPDPTGGDDADFKQRRMTVTP